MRSLLTRVLPDWGPIFLRLALGTVFMAHGWAKLGSPLGTSGGFNIANWGWPYPVFWAWVVVLVETFGGLLIVVGLLTRVAALLIATAAPTPTSEFATPRPSASAEASVWFTELTVRFPPATIPTATPATACSRRATTG